MPARNPETTYVHCAREGCQATHPDHQWGAIAAHDEGWFAQKDGTVYCPLHHPEWVAGWRAKQQGGG